MNRTSLAALIRINKNDSELLEAILDALLSFEEYSTEGLFGGHNYYSDEAGRIGYSSPGLFGGETGFFDDHDDW